MVKCLTDTIQFFGEVSQVGSIIYTIIGEGQKNDPRHRGGHHRSDAETKLDLIHVSGLPPASLGVLDGSFEGQAAGQAPVSPWLLKSTLRNFGSSPSRLSWTTLGEIYRTPLSSREAMPRRTSAS